MFKAGDIVTLQPEWSEADERGVEFIVVEWNGDRGFIEPKHWALGTIRPRELVSDYMIRPVERHEP